MIQRKKLNINRTITSLIILSSLFYSQCYAILVDDFVEETLNKNLKITPKKIPIIVDDFAESNQKRSTLNKLKIEINEEIPTHTSTYKRKKLVISEFDNSIPILIKIKNKLTTKSKPDEGTLLEFETIEAIKINNNLYPKGTIVKARVENVSANRTMGIPADLVVGNFLINGEPLRGEISRTGANRALWVKPVSYVGTFFFGAGALLILIRGGHAKINPNEVFTVYY